MKRAAGLVVLLAAFGVAAQRPSLECYFQKTFQDTAYQKRTFQKVAAKWKAPAEEEIPPVGKKAVVQAVITKDGSLATTEISTSSGKKGWDAAALKAVTSAAPFGPLPDSYGYPTVQVHFHVSVVP